MSRRSRGAGQVAVLPPPRDPGVGGYTLALVCLGNICRSPMAHVVLDRKLAEAGRSSRVAVHSSGTGDWHTGEGMDRRAAATLVSAGYDPSRHRARLFDSDWFQAHDAILVMDRSNFDDVISLATTTADRDRVRMFREFDPHQPADLDVPDPWYGGQRGFDEVLAIVERTAEALVAALEDVPSG